MSETSIKPVIILAFANDKDAYLDMIVRERKNIFEMLPKIDCGACGSPSCETFAEDVVSGEVEFQECIIVENMNLKKKLGNIK